ncbi:MULTISPECIES: DUF433 domain-containing protein [unclassified Spirulina]|jgi:uncharacterized protein (DUF433 family)|uniref:DUF433 domain-containing protein n=1 Tax=unclassified Spirulina TaxID=2684457 RepID=UPI0019525082|nr:MULTISPECIES: DUF433 domain-containing protein [Spirulina]MEA5471604.1 DUF433 domain-containing protein [Spirulina sp. 06S082]
MPITTTAFKYIELNDRDRAIISGTRMKVVELISAIKAYNWTPEELANQYPHLQMSQIYSALAYYWEYKEQCDLEIEQRFQDSEERRLEAGESSFVARMRKLGKLK